MTSSLRTPYAWICAACGDSQQASIWLILDASQALSIDRDLGSGLTDVVCITCGHLADIEAPVLIIRPNDSTPFLLALPSHAFADPDGWIHEPGLEDFKAIVNSVVGLTGPILLLPRQLALVVLTRNITSDAEGPDQAARDVSVDHADIAGAYHSFLIVVRRAEQERKLVSTLQALWTVSPNELVTFLAEHPELRTPEAVSLARRELDLFYRRPQDSPETWSLPSDYSDEPLRARLSLIEGLASGLSADESADEYLTTIDHFGTQVTTDFYELLAEVAEIPGSEGIRRVRRAQEMATALHNDDVAVALAANLAARLLALPLIDSNNTEEAISLLQQCLNILNEDDPRWLEVAVNLASAYYRRVSGDLMTNWETKRELLERACDLCDRATDPRRWALIKTNYGLLLAERPDGTQEDLRRGIRYIQAGLEERSPERDVIDWAYSQLNLGLLYSRSELPTDQACAIGCYKEALIHLQPNEDLLLWVALQNNLADAFLTANPPDLDSAESAARDALAVISIAADPFTAGRLLWLLSRVATRRDGLVSAEAMRFRREALDVLTPGIAPDLHLTIAGELFEAYPQLNDWAHAGRCRRRSTHGIS